MMIYRGMFPLLDFYIQDFFAENFQWGSSRLETQTNIIDCKKQFGEFE